jgi:hypothetical protein
LNDYRNGLGSNGCLRLSPSGKFGLEKHSFVRNLELELHSFKYAYNKSYEMRGDGEADAKTCSKLRHGNGIVSDDTKGQ